MTWHDMAQNPSHTNGFVVLCLHVNNFIKNNNLEDKILMLGWMGHDKLKNYLKQG